jgi:hypothetical protein
MNSGREDDVSDAACDEAYRNIKHWAALLEQDKKMRDRHRGITIAAVIVASVLGPGVLQGIDNMWITPTQPEMLPVVAIVIGAVAWLVIGKGDTYQHNYEREREREREREKISRFLQIQGLYHPSGNHSTSCPRTASRSEHTLKVIRTCRDSSKPCGVTIEAPGAGDRSLWAEHRPSAQASDQSGVIG